jgi:hypothetical protein
MTTYVPRIRRNINGFNTDITITNDYLKESCEPDPCTNGERLGWTIDELKFWSDILHDWQPLYIRYGNKKAGRTTDVTDQLHQLIDKAVKYDQEHHLYDRIAICTAAVNKDFETFRIKRFTPLADEKPTSDPDPGDKTVKISLRSSEHLVHKMMAVFNGVKGRGKPEGIKEVMMFMAITGAEEAQPALEKFQYKGDVKNGFIIIKFLPTDKGKKAWYYAIPKNSKGELGVASNIEDIPII